MKGLSDIELLEAYANRHSEEAFRELVERHIDVVYSAALRQLRDPHAAQEAVQSAFLALASKAGQLPRATLIAGWLHRAVHFAARNLRRAEARRRHWEEEAAMANHADDGEGALSDEVLPHVDGALAELGESDRDAIVMRFLQQKSLRDVAVALGTTEEAAKKRVQRALERMRVLLLRQGVTISVALLAAGLAKMPVTAAPVGLSATLAGAVAQGAVPAAAAVSEIGTGLASSLPLPAKSVVVAILALVALAVGDYALRPSKSSDNSDTSAALSGRPFSMNIRMSSVLVDDQEKALKFYTEVLGFQRKRDMPAGAFRWLTVAAKDRSDLELLLEPNALPDAKTFQQAIFQQGIPLNSLGATDVRREYERMKALGVVFTQAPTEAGDTTLAIFQDTCGNLIQLHQRPARSGATDPNGISIDLNSIRVDDQEKALKFYTEVLGFQKKFDIPVGAFRWLTLVAPEDPEGMQLVLEPNANPASKAFQTALFGQGIPLTSLSVGDVQKAHDALVKKGVVFSRKPTRMGPTVLAVFEDTCGNRIQLVQQ